MKTLTNGQLYQLVPALANVIAKDTPMKVTIKLRKTLRSIKVVIEELDAIRVDKAAVHTSQTKDGIDVVDEVAFAAEMEIMLKETSEIDIHPIRTSEFPDDFAISAIDLNILLETGILTE